MSPQRPSLSDGSLRRVGRYELIAEIAKGGMATVLLGRLAGAGGFQRLYAIKLMHRHLVQDTTFIEMLHDEARIAARIHHPNVVPIVDVGESREHGHFLAMDYIEGFPLWDLLEVLPEPGAQRWRICNRVILDALFGLECAHQLTDDDGNPLHVVHRDVSPQNILVGVDGIGRVADFGIAKAAARISTTRAGQVKGKLSYMAPEQAKAGALDARTDVFAMGIVLWEVLTAQRLFRRDSDADTYARVLQAVIPSVRTIVPSVPIDLDGICAQALDRDISGRFRTAGEMAQVFEHAARAGGLLAETREVGAFIRSAFAAQLATRREAIRAAASGIVPPGMPSDVIGSLKIPTLPERSAVSLTAMPAADLARDSGVVDVPPRKPSTGFDPEDDVPTALDSPTVGAEYFEDVPTTALASTEGEPIELRLSPPRVAVAGSVTATGTATGTATATATGTATGRGETRRSGVVWWFVAGLVVVVAGAVGGAILRQRRLDAQRTPTPSVEAVGAAFAGSTGTPPAAPSVSASNDASAPSFVATPR